MQNRTKKDKTTILFEKIPVRRFWFEKDEKWYFVIKDVVAALCDNLYIKEYVVKIRKRDNLSRDWKKITTPFYFNTKGGRQKIDCANIEGITRILQSIFSKRAQLLKEWMVETGYDKLQKGIDPESEVFFTALLKISKIKVPKKGRVSKKI